MKRRTELHLLSLIPLPNIVTSGWCGGTTASLHPLLSLTYIHTHYNNLWLSSDYTVFQHSYIILSCIIRCKILHSDTIYTKQKSNKYHLFQDFCKELCSNESLSLLFTLYPECYLSCTLFWHRCAPSCVISAKKHNHISKESSGELRNGTIIGCHLSKNSVYQISTTATTAWVNCKWRYCKWKCLRATTAGHIKPTGWYHRVLGKLSVLNSSGVTSTSGGAKQCWFSWLNRHRQA